MQNDLIRRSDVIKALEECNLDKQLFERDVFKKVNEIPTAYDVDKVVAELEEHPNVFRPFGGDGHYIPLRDAIEVVNAGGIVSQWWNS